MKKIILFFALLLAYAAQAQVVITAVVDGTCQYGRPKVVELYVIGSHDFTGDTLQIQTNSHTDWNMRIGLDAFGTITDDYAYVYYDGSNDNLTTEFPSTAGKPAIEDTHVAFNGDDRVRVVDENGTVLDLFGTPGVDADDDYSQNGIDWRYRDSWAKRQSGQGPNSTFTVSEWDFGGRDALDNKCSATDGTPLEDDMGGLQTYVLNVDRHQIADLHLYPNPVTGGVLNISASENIREIRIFDLLGKEVLTAQPQDGKVDVSALNAGMYLVKVVSQNGNSDTVKLVIR